MKFIILCILLIIFSCSGEEIKYCEDGWCDNGIFYSGDTIIYETINSSHIRRLYVVDNQLIKVIRYD